MRPQLFYDPLLLTERLGQAATDALRLRKLRKTPAKVLRKGHIDSLELLELLRSLIPSVIFNIGGNIGVATDDYAYQGSGINGNVSVIGNVFTNVGTAFNVGGGGVDMLADCVVSSNTAWNCGRFADGIGWSTNITFLGNTSSGTRQVGYLHSENLGGQWFIDDLSNNFPSYPRTGAGGRRPPNVSRLRRRDSGVGQLGGLTPVYYVDDAHAVHMPPGAFFGQRRSPRSVKWILSTTSKTAASTSVPPLYTAQLNWQGPSVEFGVGGLAGAAAAGLPRHHGPVSAPASQDPTSVFAKRPCSRADHRLLPAHAAQVAGAGAGAKHAARDTGWCGGPFGGSLVR